MRVRAIKVDGWREAGVTHLGHAGMMQTGDRSDRDIVATAANPRLRLFFNAIRVQAGGILSFFFP
jgi:hypothetical protein